MEESTTTPPRNANENRAEPAPLRNPTAAIPVLALRPREAAAALGVSERTLWAWTAAGEIPFIKRGACLLYPVEALRRWLDAQAEGGGR